MRAHADTCMLCGFGFVCFVFGDSIDSLEENEKVAAAESCQYLGVKAIVWHFEIKETSVTLQNIKFI